MQYQIDRQEESLLVIIKDLTVDLSFISTELDDQYRHLILDFQNFQKFLKKSSKTLLILEKMLLKKILL